MSEYKGWTVEQADDGWWEVRGDGAPSHARWTDLPGCLDVAAEEAKRLEVPDDMLIEVRTDTPYMVKAGHLMIDYGA